MRIVQRQEPVFDVQLSSVEATAALQAVRVTQAVLKSAEALNSHQKAALAFAVGMENLLLKKGVKESHPEIPLIYPASEPAEAPKAKPKKAPQRRDPEEEESLDNIDSLIDGAEESP